MKVKRIIWRWKDEFGDDRAGYVVVEKPPTINFRDDGHDLVRAEAAIEKRARRAARNLR